MAYFSNGSEGDYYQDRYCFKCQFWHEDDQGREQGCPIWLLHLLHVGEREWQSTLDRLIPMKPVILDGIAHTFPDTCTAFTPRDR